MTVFRVGGITITIGNRKLGAKGEYVGRPSPLGNPFEIDVKAGNTRAKVIVQYREWLKGKIAAGDPIVLHALEVLRKKALKKKALTLVCWCSPEKCHASEIGEVLAEALSRGGTFNGKGSPGPSEGGVG